MTPLDPDETATWKSRGTVLVSGFFDTNAGLLLVAPSQLFVSAMNLSIKWLNSQDEPVPLGQNGECLSVYHIEAKLEGGNKAITYAPL